MKYHRYIYILLVGMIIGLLFSRTKTRIEVREVVVKEPCGESPKTRVDREPVVREAAASKKKLANHTPATKRWIVGAGLGIAQTRLSRTATSITTGSEFQGEALVMYRLFPSWLPFVTASSSGQFTLGVAYEF